MKHPFLSSLGGLEYIECTFESGVICTRSSSRCTLMMTGSEIVGEGVITRSNTVHGSNVGCSIPFTFNGRCPSIVRIVSKSSASMRYSGIHKSR
jgi:hypothetical protein